MPTVRTAVGLDIGSNTFSCCMLHRHQDGRIEMTRDASVPVRLSESLTPGGLLRPEAMERGLETLKTMARDFDMRAVPVKAVATAVLRITANPRDFVQPAEAIIGHAIEIIDGETEALYTSLGAMLDMPEFSDVAVLDIGGQSTEICRQRSDGQWLPMSLPVGVVSLTEQVGGGDCLTTGQILSMRDRVRRIFETACGHTEVSSRCLVCVGGTATTLSTLEQQLERFDRSRIHGHRLCLDAISRWLDIMAPLSTEARISRYHLRPLRADVFPAGMVIILEVLRCLGLDHLIVSANGLRVGVALSILETA